MGSGRGWRTERHAFHLELLADVEPPVQVTPATDGLALAAAPTTATAVGPQASARQALPNQAPSLRELPEPPDTVKARELLAELVVADEDDVPGYSRAKFPHWVTQYGTCDTREVTLQRVVQDVVQDDGCRAVSGTWYSE
ncbi:hypothetical protein [Streptomyces sp. NPDC001948]